MKAFASTRFKRITTFTAAFLLAVSTFTAFGPLFLSRTAEAASSTVCASGCDFTSIQAAVDDAGTVAGDIITVAAGDYSEVNITKPVTITGAGAATTRIVGSSANVTPVVFNTNGATVSGFTITHDYTPAELTAWNFNNNGVTFGQGRTGNTLQNNTISKNRNGVYINNAQGNTISGNVITDNRTGLNLTNNVNNTQIVGNTISHNWTLGLVYYSQGFATNFNSLSVDGNNFNNNWYSEVVVKDAGATSGTLDLRDNTFSDTPVVLSISADPSLNEPSFSAQQPVSLGGSATSPATTLPTLRLYNSPSASIIYDLPAPTLISPSNNAFVTGASLTNSWGSVPGISQYEYQSYHNASATSIRFTGLYNATSKTATNVADTTFWWRVRAVDAAGNRGDWSELWKVTVDSTAPSKPLLDQPSNGAYLATNEFDFDWHDSIDASPVTYEYQASQDPSRDANEVLNGSNIWHSPNPLPTSMIHSSGAGNGAWFYQVRAKDAAGNYSPWSDIWSVVIDTQAPTATINFPGIGPSATGFSVQFSEAVNPVEASNPANYFLNNWPGAGGSGDLAGDAIVAYNPVTHVTTVSFTNPGWYISAEQQWGIQNIHDLAGNAVTPNPTTTYSSPLVAPTVPGTPTTGSTTTTDLTLSWSWGASTDPGGNDASGLKGYEYAFVAQGETPSSWTFTTSTTFDTTVAGDGVYELHVRALDNAGNRSGVAIGSVIVDTTPIEVSINSLNTSDTTPTITGTVNDPTAVITLTIDGGSPEPAINNGDGTWSYTFADPLTDGTYVLEVVAVDGFGLSASASANLVVATTTVIPSTGDPEPTTTVTLTPITPLIVTPAAATILGATTDNPTDEDTDVEGANTLETPAAIDTDATDGSILGLAWYWWILIIAALVTLAWGIISAFRRRGQES